MLRTSTVSHIIHSLSTGFLTKTSLESLKSPEYDTNPKIHIHDEDEEKENLSVDDFVHLSKKDLGEELNSVAVDWQSLRNSQECPCGFPLEGNPKIHCRRCGRIFCKRCIPKKIHLPGHSGEKAATPVCVKCSRLMTPGSQLHSFNSASVVSDED